MLIAIYSIYDQDEAAIMIFDKTEKVKEWFDRQEKYKAVIGLYYKKSKPCLKDKYLYLTKSDGNSSPTNFFQNQPICDFSWKHKVLYQLNKP